MSEAAAVSASRGRVGMAIRQASIRSGIDFDYLYQQARVESGLNPAARARTSSASGLYQFIDQTWLATVDRHGERLGYGWAAAAIQRDGNGRYRVPDTALREGIMQLRFEPEAAASMAAAFASDNAGYLRARIGREPVAVDLYLAHFLGPAGAARFLERHAQDPQAPAAPEMPSQAAANRGVFFRNGQALSFEAIRARFAERFSSEGAAAGSVDPPSRPLRAGMVGTLADVEQALRALGTAGPQAISQPRGPTAPGLDTGKLAALLLSEALA